MLTIVLPELELFDDEAQRFITLSAAEVQLEHSLVSLSKWESKFEKPFLDKNEKTDEEVFHYIECMISSGGLPQNFTKRLTDEQLNSISSYIDAKMSATWFSDKSGRPSREIITSELIYYWMVSLSIPFECQYWHLNRLLTLIKVVSLKSQPQKKMSRAEIAQRNRELNAQRRSEYKTTG